MYLLTIGEQFRIFLYSCGFGFLLGFLFSLFDLVLCFLPKKKVSVISVDILYMVTVTFLMNIFSLSVDNGSFKFYIYASSLLGWIIYYFTLYRFVNKIKNFVCSIISFIFKKIKYRILSMREYFLKKREKKSKKIKKSSKFLLQDDKELLYNKEDLEFKEKGSDNEDEKVF